MNSNHPSNPIPLADLARETIAVMTRYLQEPWTQIRHLPEWPWPRLIGTQLALSAGTGALSGLTQSIAAVFVGFFFSPLVSLATLSITALALLYFTKIVSKKEIPYQSLWTLTFFANIPLFLIQIVSVYVPIISLAGLAFAAYLIYLGLTETHKVEKLIAKKVLAGLFALYLAVWLWSKIDMGEFERKFREPVVEAPEVHLGK